MNCTCMSFFHSSVQVERENRQNAGRRARTLLLVLFWRWLDGLKPVMAPRRMEMVSLTLMNLMLL